MVLLRRPVRRSRAQVKCRATIPVPDSQPVITDLGWHTDFAQHYVKVGVGVLQQVEQQHCSHFKLPCKRYAIRVREVLTKPCYACCGFTVCRAS
jgi:hypothetical protein